MSEWKGKQEPLREQLAYLAHEQWSGWMRHLFSKCDINDKLDGSMVIPKWAVERWMRQATTPYPMLEPSEQESDRKEADSVLHVVREHQQIGQKEAGT